jgi:HD-GYP domain-containing protein (c-di-GMP phosphodiesterase class II)
VRAAVPLRCGDRILGALEATSVDSRRFGRKDLDLLSELAELSSPALAHAERRAQSLATVGKRVRALLARIDAHDGYTAGHSEAVGALSCWLGERLRLSLVDLFELELAALFHDVGKLAVPETILSKSDSLDHQELAVVRYHAIWGAELLASIPGLAPVATLVRFHHERWDGGGYPDGLDGERIPLASRILAVCDAYHAMTSDRSYRAALPRERAVAELRSAAGHQFDPAVVDSFLALVGDAGRSSDPARRRRVARAFELAHPPVAAR